MKFSHYDFDTVFDIDPLCPNVLVVEDEDCFFKYYEELHNQINGEEGNFCLSAGDKALPLSKCSVLIDNYLNLDINNKKIVTRLYQHLKTETEEKLNSELTSLLQDWSVFFEKLNSESCCPIDYDDEDLINSIFKSFAVKLYSESGSLLEQILYYIKTLNELLSIKIFFFVNLRTVLTEFELLSFYKECALNDCSVFLLENTYKTKIESEYLLLLDRDFCEIMM